MYIHTLHCGQFINGYFTCTCTVGGCIPGVQCTVVRLSMDILLAPALLEAVFQEYNALWLGYQWILYLHLHCWRLYPRSTMHCDMSLIQQYMKCGLICTVMHACILYWSKSRYYCRYMANNRGSGGCSVVAGEMCFLTLVLQIPAGVQSHHKIRLSGRGIPRLNGYGSGDHYVHIKIQIPK